MKKRFVEDMKRIRLPLAVLVIYMLCTQLIFHTVCPWAILTHYPCPACGLTRAGLCVFTLRFREAARWNAMIFLWMPYLLYMLIMRYVVGKKPRYAFGLAVAIAALTCIYFGVRVGLRQLPENIIPLHLYRFPKIW